MTIRLNTRTVSISRCSVLVRLLRVMLEGIVLLRLGLGDLDLTRSGGHRIVCILAEPLVRSTLWCKLVRNTFFWMKIVCSLFVSGRCAMACEMIVKLLLFATNIYNDSSEWRISHRVRSVALATAAHYKADKNYDWKSKDAHSLSLAWNWFKENPKWAAISTKWLSGETAWSHCLPRM